LIISRLELKKYYSKSIPEYKEHTSVVILVVVYELVNLDHLLLRESLYAEEEERMNRKRINN